jgi:transposase-like protein
MQGEEAVALAKKQEKPINQVVKDLEVSEKILYCLMQKSWEAAGSGLHPFPGHERPRDEELSRLRKEVKSLREASD